MTSMRLRFVTLAAAALIAVMPVAASANTISGTIDPGAVWADFYGFSVGAGGTNFSAQTTSAANVQLWLFDNTVHGLFAMDSSPDWLQANLGSGSYLLAVSLWDIDPFAANGGLIFPNHTTWQYAPDNPDTQLAYWQYVPWNGAPEPTTASYTVNLGGTTGVFDHSDIVATPEPASLTLFGTGIVGMAGRAWRRRRSRQS